MLVVKVRKLNEKVHEANELEHILYFFIKEMSSKQSMLYYFFKGCFTIFFFFFLIFLFKLYFCINLILPHINILT